MAQQKPFSFDDYEDVETPGSGFSFDDFDDAEPVTDMDLPSEPVVAEPFQLSPAQMELPDIPVEPSVVSEPKGLWETLRTPMTNIGERFTAPVGTVPNPETEYMDPEGQAMAEMGNSVAKFFGAGVDQSTAPLDLTATIATGAGSKLGIPAIGMLGRAASGLTGVSGLQRINEADSWMGRGLGALEAIGGFFGMKGSPKAGKVAETIDIPTPTASVDEVITPSSPRTFETNVEGSAGKTADEVITEPVIETVTRPTTLPKDLAGALPRYNIGDKNYLPQFSSDVDKALYILAQKTPSKRNDDYLKFVMEATGITDPDEVLQLAAKVKQGVRATAANATVTGDIKINQIWKPDTAAKAAPDVKAQSGGRISNLDYSPSSLDRAQKIVDENGLPTGGLSANEVINLAETLQPGHQGVVPKTIKVPSSIAKPGSSAQATVNGDGTWSPKSNPDYKVNPQTGEIVGTHSGKPVEFPTPAAKEAAKRHFLVELGNDVRALVGSADLSFPLRQGLGLVHKGAWWKSWGPMVKSFGSDKAYQGVLDSIAAKPNAQTKAIFKDGKAVQQPSVYERAGLVTTGGSTAAEMEHFKSRAENLPWVKASNRAYTAFAHKLRSDTFDSLVEDFKKAGIDVTKDDEMLKSLGGFVNAASGRGGLGAAEKHADALNAIFFSPRLAAARIQMGAQSAAGIFDPKVYALKTPSVRREYIKSMLAQGAAWATMTGALQQMGAEVSMDPTSSDFGKARFGNTRLDPGGGLQQFVVLANRIARQQTSRTDRETGETEQVPFGGAGPFDPNTAKTVGNFLYNKEAPLVRFVHDWASRNVKEPFDTTDQIGRMVLPILVQDILEIINDPEANAGELATVPLGAFGVGTQTYGGDMRRRLLGPNFGQSLAFPRDEEENFFNQPR